MTIIFASRQGEAMTIIKGWHFTEILNGADDKKRQPAEVFVLYGPGVTLTIQMGEPEPGGLSHDPTPLR
jgi:hypothetical protein